MIENQSETSKKKIMLGYSKKYTLYDSGCLVHCVARLLQKPVLEVHEKLKKSNCFFADGSGDVCLLDLTKIPVAYQELKYLGKQVFNQEKALEVIKQAGGVIIEVDSNSIMKGTQQHFVFFIGGKKMEDPLGGVIRKSNYYKSIISMRPFIKENNMRENEKRILDFVREKKLTEGQIRQAVGWLLDNTVAKQDEEIDGLKATISEQYKEMDKKNLEYGKLLDEYNVLLPKYEELLKNESAVADENMSANFLELSWGEVFDLIYQKLFIKKKL